MYMFNKKLIMIQLLLFSTMIFASSKIVFPLKEYNFGQIKQKERVVYDFKFINKGNDTLIIKDVKSSCGCTVTKPAKKRLAPGEESKIGVTFNSGHFTGNVRKVITVKSNDPENPVFQLSIYGKILVDLRISPPTIYIYTRKGKEKQDIIKRQIELKSYSKKPVKILSAETKTPLIKIKPSSFPVVIKPGKTFKIDVEVATFGIEKGWKKLGDIIIKTDSRINPLFNVRVFFSS